MKQAEDDEKKRAPSEANDGLHADWRHHHIRADFIGPPSRMRRDA